jgi:hypothetical protein
VLATITPHATASTERDTTPLADEGTHP